MEGELEMAKLPDGTIRQALASLPGWELTEEGLRKKFEFAGFPEAVRFVDRLVQPAEAAQHHPNIAIVYRWVTLILTTHDEGGVTQKDIDLARAIESLVF
jgi:4a-hydroxytetrahydrobiopterin dehydratase